MHCHALDATARDAKGLKMANKKRKCKRCGEYRDAESGVQTPSAWFCCHAHAIEFSIEASRKRTDRLRLKAVRAHEQEAKNAAKRDRERTAKRKKELNRSHHLDQLQKLVNQWVVHVRDKDKPCCTCGTTNPFIKYDAGHYRSRGACPEARFIPTNIHRQCSVRCNVYGSGMRAEYIEFLRSGYGQEHLDWLDGPHHTLKEQLPDADAIDAEMARYRKMLREAGLKPNA
ncbi:Bacteriophage Lambda NinG protein [compost metagenome]